MGQLMSLSGRNDIDPVILNRANPVPIQQVAHHVRVLFEGEPGARAHFEVAALRRYVDTARLRRIQGAPLGRVEEYRTAMGES
jgi:hypothetical protein